MPVKRRNAKRRIDLREVMEAWTMPLVSGWDFFRELPAIGVEVDRQGCPDLELAREAWRTFGPTILAERGPTEGATWAERTFGKPWEVETNDAD